SPTGVVPCEQGLCHPFKERGNVHNDRLVHKATKRKECTVEPRQGKLPEGLYTENVVYTRVFYALPPGPDDDEGW
ncbi:hypothetical protein HaLaN_19626, partial [Haematococcus lacustris]